MHPSSGGGSALLRASIAIGIDIIIMGEPDVTADLILTNPNSPLQGVIQGNVVCTPVKLGASPPVAGEGFVPSIFAPNFTAGALIIDNNFTQFMVIDIATGGQNNYLNLSPSGAPTPLSIPSGSDWHAANPADWIVNSSNGTDLSLSPTGEIVSAVGAIYSAMWVVGFSQVPTK